jgi:hypothetical protein
MTNETADAQAHETPGPLKIPMPPDVATRRAVTEKLHGHTTAASWLPEGIWPELDELRAEQLRLRAQVAAEVHALENLVRKFSREDSEHNKRLREAQRAGTVDSVEDRRTPAEQRAAERGLIEERLWAGVHVFAEHAERIIETVREHEDEWLADLRSRLGPAQEKRHEAARLLAEAKAEEFRLYQLGGWLQTTADDQGFGRQPAPALGPIPEKVSRLVFQDKLERPWHKLRPWNQPAKTVTT